MYRCDSIAINFPAPGQGVRSLAPALPSLIVCVQPSNVSQEDGALEPGSTHVCGGLHVFLLGGGQGRRGGEH